ncbi:uncharacterized protein LOC130623868 [Hydractinia symbiolongicarpus]|uniref:uncharacterized protein LOC130623868 n=1 Tax=Hydractinia symbiolongicarpus TaxID=13093 RepID=UPI00254EAADD|nr:uncharacterized protein LOC130623868 [Hydractinia symbiolongicarpus]
MIKFTSICISLVFCFYFVKTIEVYRAIRDVIQNVKENECNNIHDTIWVERKNVRGHCSCNKLHRTFKIVNDVPGCFSYEEISPECDGHILIAQYPGGELNGEISHDINITNSCHKSIMLWNYTASLWELLDSIVDVTTEYRSAQLDKISFQFDPVRKVEGRLMKLNSVCGYVSCYILKILGTHIYNTISPPLTSPTESTTRPTMKISTMSTVKTMTSEAIATLTTRTKTANPSTDASGKNTTERMSLTTISKFSRTLNKNANKNNMTVIIGAVSGVILILFIWAITIVLRRRKLNRSKASTPAVNNAAYMIKNQHSAPANDYDYATPDLQMVSHSQNQRSDKSTDNVYKELDIANGTNDREYSQLSYRNNGETFEHKNDMFNEPLYFETEIETGEIDEHVLSNTSEPVYVETVPEE